jgi:HD superfamily phosphodiesterase
MNATLGEKIDSYAKLELANQDDSHGLGHAISVAHRALFIMNIDYNWPAIELKVYAASMLHDAADHKYDLDGSARKKLESFLEIMFPLEGAKLMRVIDRVSYSKEKRIIAQGVEAHRKWLSFDGDQELETIRNIVSDADKLEALGADGVIRCIQYVQATHPEFDIDSIRREVTDHVKDKLFHLVEFLRTPAGISMGSDLHNETQDAVKNQLDVLIRSVTGSS